MAHRLATSRKVFKDKPNKHFLLVKGIMVLKRYFMSTVHVSLNCKECVCVYAGRIDLFIDLGIDISSVYSQLGLDWASNP